MDTLHGYASTDYERMMNDNDCKKYKGTIYETGERCIMINNGFWLSGTRKISSYIRIDKPDNCQYSKDRHNRFYVETVD